MKENTVSQEQIDKILNDANKSENVIFDKCLVVTVKLKNGFIIVESSACVDVKNFDITIGREICYDRIKNKLWELEGYKLQCELANVSSKLA